MKKPLKVQILSELSKSPEKVMVVVDFMAYTRKIPVKTAKLKTYGDMAKHLWATFTKLTSDYARRILFWIYT